MTETLDTSQRGSYPQVGPETDEARKRPAWRRWLRSRLPLFVTGFLIAAIALAYFWTYVFISIGAGEAGVLWKRFSGTRTDRVYHEGLHIISPLDRMYHYEVRKQVAMHEFDVLSIEGLRLHLKLAIRFQPEYDLLGMLHEHIGPDYLTRIVIPQTESVLRKQLGKATAEQIYTNEGGLLTRARLEAMAEAGRNFVEVEDIIIRSVSLPKVVRAAIEDKLKQQQLLASYQFRRQTALQEAERKRIEAAGIGDFQAIVNETLTDRLLTFQGIEASRAIARSNNEKTIITGVGSGTVALPIFLGETDKRSPDVRARKVDPRTTTSK